MKEQNTIKFDPFKLKLFKLDYDRAIRESKKTFIFQGDEFDVNYARYLIEYLESKFRRI